MFFLKAKIISTPFTRRPDFSSGCPPGKMLKSEKLIRNPPSSPFYDPLSPFHTISIPRWPFAGVGFWISSWLGPRLSLHSRPPVHLAGRGTFKLCNKNFGTFTFTLGTQHLSEADPVYSKMPLCLEISSNTAHKLHTKNPWVFELPDLSTESNKRILIFKVLQWIY